MGSLYTGASFVLDLAALLPSPLMQVVLLLLRRGPPFHPQEVELAASWGQHVVITGGNGVPAAGTHDGKREG